MGVVIRGSVVATCTQRILATLIEKGVTDYEFIPVNIRGGEQKTPEFKAKQPFGVIPVLEDGDFTVYESRAICFYIASKYADQGVKLLPDPTDIKATTTFQKWSSVEFSNFDAYALPLAIENVFKKWRGEEADPKLVEHFESGFAPKLDVYDSILAKQEYMGGNEFSLIDIYYVVYAQALFLGGTGHLINDRPHVKAWWEKVSGRESWKKVLAMGQNN